MKQKFQKNIWGVCRGLIPLKPVTVSYFLFGGGSLRKSQELSLCSIFKMLISKYLYGQWLIRINTKKIIWGGCRGLIPLKPVTVSYFLFGWGSLRKPQELSLCSIFKMLVSKYSYGQWLIRINTKKIIWGGCEGLSPLKPQSRPKMVFLTASSRLSYGNKIEKNIWDIFSTISDHF